MINTIARWFCWLITRYIGIFHVVTTLYIPFHLLFGIPCALLVGCYDAVKAECRYIRWEFSRLTWKKFMKKLRDCYTRKAYIQLKRFIDKEMK